MNTTFLLNKTQLDDLVNTDRIIPIIIQTLKTLDSTLIEHSERIAYIAYKLNCEVSPSVDQNTLLLLSLFHDIGNLKNPLNASHHSLSLKQKQPIYSYLFLKYLSPIHEYADIILSQHLSYDKLTTLDVNHKSYIDFIYFANELDKLLFHDTLTDQEIDLYFKTNSHQFNPTLLEAFMTLNKQSHLTTELRTYSSQLIYPILKELNLSTEDSIDFLKMFLYSFDFKSTQTVTHTITTVIIALSLATLSEVDESHHLSIYLGALLHDIGKIAIPDAILESTGRLTEDEMVIMRKHVVYTKKIVSHLVNSEIANIASRHHERLDGSGYPCGLTEGELTFNEQILACADVLSALISQRSYKKPFPKTQVLDILNELKQKNHLNPKICELIALHYDEIIAVTFKESAPIIAKYHMIQTEYLRLTKHQTKK